MTGEPEPGYQLLLAKLQGVKPMRRHWPTWKAHCPCHDDTDRMFLLEYKRSRDGDMKLLGICNKKELCGARLSEVCLALDLRITKVLANNGRLSRDVGLRIPPDLLPSPADIARWMRNLEGDEKALAYLLNERGLTTETIKRYDVGLGSFRDGRRYTLPVYANGEVVNLRRYRPGAAKGKMKGLQGRTSKHLYPDVPPEGWLLLCEGEWDALLARQHGLPAITSTGGILGWDECWNELLRGRNVAIAYDCQDVSHRAAHRRAGELSAAGGRVKVVDLGLEEKEDLTDWFVKYGRTKDDLLALIRAGRMRSGTGNGAVPGGKLRTGYEGKRKSRLARPGLSTDNPKE